MTKEEVRIEINYRLERETRYVLAEVGATEVEKGILEGRIRDNNVSIKLLGEFLIKEYGDSWERFYKEWYWDKR